jgi:hypothetical protein
VLACFCARPLLALVGSHHRAHRRTVPSTRRCARRQAARAKRRRDSRTADAKRHTTEAERRRHRGERSSDDGTRARVRTTPAPPLRRAPAYVRRLSAAHRTGRVTDRQRLQLELRRLASSARLVVTLSERREAPPLSKPKATRHDSQHAQHSPHGHTCSGVTTVAPLQECLGRVRACTHDIEHTHTRRHSPRATADPHPHTSTPPPRVESRRCGAVRRGAAWRGVARAWRGRGNSATTTTVCAATHARAQRTPRSGGTPRQRPPTCQCRGPPRGCGACGARVCERACLTARSMRRCERNETPLLASSNTATRAFQIIFFNHRAQTPTKGPPRDASMKGRL